ncbi:MAG: bifunctional UDP-N-acetylglucosamine diphosphorylase/glucosamine-1-phosphate N-acetyltransferase GlmU [Hyphomicrobiales bacterium]
MNGSSGVVVLAAGQGTRMKSALPKPLHPVCGLPMARHVINAARELSPSRLVVVVGHESAFVREALAAPDVGFVEQTELLGTGDAVRRCQEALAGCETVVVLNGDEPLVTGDSLRRLVAALDGRTMAFGTQRVADAGALGRVLRDDAGEVRAIVQAADYDGPPGEAEINWGQYAFEAVWLWEMLTKIPVSPKGEYYLTKLADFAYDAGTPAATVPVPADEALGVDDRVKLAEAERRMRRRVLERHMRAGVTIVDPETTYIDATVEIAQDVTVLPNCYLQGETRVAANVTIGPGTTLRNSRVGEGCEVRQSVIEESELGRNVRVGPFAHVRAGAVIGDDCELGNYSEVKNSNVGRGVKMHHFSYLGDADVGEGTNFAAGAITCNWDGVNKNRTTIGRGVFIGCDTMLIAPVTIGDNAVTGAGSVVTKDIGDGVKVAGVPARPMGHATPAD